MTNVYKNRMAVDSLIANVKSQEHKNVFIKSVEVVSNDIIRVVASTVNTESLESLSGALKAKFHNKLHPIEGSFVTLSSDKFNTVFSGFLSAYVESVPATEDILKELSSLSSNIYLDKEDQIWSLTKTSAGDFLIKKSELESLDYLKDILDHVSVTASSNSPELASLASITSKAEEELAETLLSVSGGDFLYYVDTETTRTDFGLVAASIEDDSNVQKLLVVKEDGSYSSIPNIAVIANISNEELIEMEDVQSDVLYAEASSDPQKLIEYYSLVYGYNSKYLNDIKEIIKSHTFM